VIVTDGAAAWVGSDSGNVKRIELQSDQVTGGSTKCWLEHTHTLRHQAKRRRSSTVFSSTASAELDDLSRVDSARASEDYTAGEEQPAVGIVGVRAHAGPVTAVEAHQNLVFTSGGSASYPALHQWAQNGVLQHSQKLKELGKCSTGLVFWEMTDVWSASPSITHRPAFHHTKALAFAAQALTACASLQSDFMNAAALACLAHLALHSHKIH